METKETQKKYYWSRCPGKIVNKYTGNEYALKTENLIKEFVAEGQTEKLIKEFMKKLAFQTQLIQLNSLKQ